MYTIKVGRPRAHPKTVLVRDRPLSRSELSASSLRRPSRCSPRQRARWRIVLEKREEQVCLGHFGSSIMREYALMTLVRMTLGNDGISSAETRLSPRD